MNKPYLTIILLIWLTAGSLCNIVTAKTKYNHRQSTKQITQHKFAFKALTAQDRKNYLLTVDQSKIGKPHDTILYKGKRKVFDIPVKLSNFSNDTLRYLSMSCSLRDFFLINTKKIEFLGEDCDSNFPVVKMVLPHKSVLYNLPVLTNTNFKDNKFSVGMNVFIIGKQNKNFSHNLPPVGYYRPNHLIWSNQVTVR